MKCYWFIFSKTDLLLQKDTNDQYSVPLASECPIEIKPWTTIHNITPMEDGTAVHTLVVDNIENLTIANNNSSNEIVFVPLRASYNVLPLALYLKAGKCQEINYWHQNTKFCGVCGGTMKLHTDISKRCTECGKEIWPQLATAVIVLIEKSVTNEDGSKHNEILLVRARNFKRNFYGLVAGFVETGETLEEAVAREVKEEVGLEIKDIKYFASQPWPYPCGLMVGFKAKYASGNIKMQEEEIERAGWFHKDNLPNIPEKLSIARQLIDSWLETN